MTRGTSLPSLIATVTADARSDDAVDQLAAAAATAAELQGVGDALLTHFVDQCRERGHSWTEISEALGVTKQAVHKRFSPPIDPRLARFTPRAREAVRAATDSAKTLGHSYVGTEHFLLGVFEPAAGIAARILAETGITRTAVEAELLKLEGTTSSVAIAEPMLTPRAERYLARCNQEAAALGHNYVGTEHLLLALFDDADSLGSNLLTGLGLDRDRVRQRAVEMLISSTKPQTGNTD